MDDPWNERAFVLESPSVAFGTAGVFRLPGARERKRLVDAAFDAGFRHFDVAPMYGMGKAEGELAGLLKRHGGDISVTTKFGIDVSIFGRAAGSVQGPIRRVLASRPSMNTNVQKAASGPTSSLAGRLLYRPTGFSLKAASASLNRSLATLRRGTIDLFILHDPLPEEMVFAERDGTFAFLEAQRVAGRIRNWGLAVHDLHLTGLGASALEQAPFVQFRDHLFLEPFASTISSKQVATYGSLAGSLPLIEQHLASDTAVRSRWVSELDLTEHGPRSLASIILRQAARRNPFGPVLFTTTKSHRLETAMEAIQFAAPSDEAAAVQRLVSEITQRQARP